MLTFIMAALIVGFFAGMFASHKNFVLPAQEAEAALRKELKEAREELFKKDNDIANLKWWLAATPMTDERWLAYRGSTMRGEPTIKHRAPSDVFKIDSIDALIEGTR